MAALLQVPAANAQAVTGFALDKPERSFRLPKSLTEISDITAVDADTIACVQDEKGILYFVDLRNGKIAEKVRFGADGDYEGLTRVGAEYWVLRSDGLLLHLGRKAGDLVVVSEHALNLPNELESLCHDEAEGRLLLAPKDTAGQDEKDELPIRAWNLRASKLEPEPVLVLSRKRLRADAIALDPQLPAKPGHKKVAQAALKLKVSALAVCPATGELLLLSAVDRALLVVDRRGRLKAVHVFAADDLPQPEAITFLPGGELAIASEGRDGPAVLNVYRRGEREREREPEPEHPRK